MKSVQDRAAQARAYNAAYPPRAHQPVIDPYKLAKDHDAKARQLDEVAHRQNWGKRTLSYTSPRGVHYFRHESATHDTNVIHHGTETIIHRKHLSPPANYHATQRATIDAMQGTWGRRLVMKTLPGGVDSHVFRDSTHITKVVHKGAEWRVHRKPISH